MQGVRGIRRGWALATARRADVLALLLPRPLQGWPRETSGTRTSEGTSALTPAVKATDFSPGDLVDLNGTLARIVSVDESDDTVQISFVYIDVDPEIWLPWLPGYGQWYPASQVRPWEERW